MAQGFASAYDGTAGLRQRFAYNQMTNWGQGRGPVSPALNDSIMSLPTGPTPASVSTPTAPASAAPNPTDTRLAAGTAATPVDYDRIIRNGNSFSGKDIGGNFMYQDARTGALTAPRNPIQVMPSSYDPTSPQVTAGGLRSGNFGGADGALSAARAAAADRGDFDAVARSYGQPSASDTNQYPTAESLGLRGRRADRYTQQMVARMGMDTQRAINERNVELGLRGQDMTYAGHMAANKLGMFNALREQGNWQAGHDLEVQRNNFTERGQREQQVQSNIEKMFTTMDGDKPVVNQALAQQARQGFDRSIARLGLKGPQDLSPMDEQRLYAATSLLQKMRDNAGMMPWSPDKLKTIDPLDLVGMRVLPNGDRQIARKGSGAFGQIIPQRLFTTEEGTRMGNWFGTGTPTNRYDILSMGQ